MKVIIVQYGKDVAQEAREELEKRIETVQVKSIDADDRFNALAHVKKYLEKGNHVIMFMEIDEDKPSLNSGFYSGLSYLQVDTGEKIFKEMYKTLQEPEVEGTVEKFVDSVL